MIKQEVAKLVGTNFLLTLTGKYKLKLLLLYGSIGLVNIETENRNFPKKNSRNRKSQKREKTETPISRYPVTGTETDIRFGPDPC